MSIRYLLALAAFAATSASAADIDIFDGDSFEAAVEGLNPGDTLTVHAGTYTDSGRISIQVRGTQASPVVIQAAPGARPLITRSPGDPVQNTINIEGAEHLTIRGLEITGNGGDAINMSGEPSYITLEDLVIHDISVGINFRSSMHHITVRGNHIYNTNDTGEGMYVGCNFAACAVSDSLIENNWIHDTLNADQGDGIEIKRGSHSNIIRNNVIHDTNWPCILLYGTEGNPRNVVEGNVMWNCGDSGMQVAADAVIRNNIILESPGSGFNSQSHQGVSPNNLEFVHNTLVGGSPCLRLNGWDGKQGMVFANNAVYCSSSNYVIGGLGGVTIAGNVFDTAPSAFPGSGYSDGRSTAQDFVDAAGRDLYPTSDSPLLGAGDASHAAASDFNGTARSGGVDAGAYAWTGAQNPGWPVAPGFKDAANPAPTLNFSASPSTVDYQGQSTLNWSAANATSCVASGDWSGSKPITGQQQVGPLMADSDFELACSNAGGTSVSDIASVTVRPMPAAAPTLSLTANPTTVSMNGASALSWSTTDADDCMASNAWAGARPTSGNEDTGTLTASATYTLDCTGPGGNVTRSVTVAVQASNPGGGGSSSSSGSGSVGWVFLLLLAVARAAAAGFLYIFSGSPAANSRRNT